MTIICEFEDNKLMRSDKIDQRIDIKIRKIRSGRDWD